MDIFTGHLFEWLVLIALIVAAIYTMRVIGQENSTFRQDSYEVRFGDLALMIPNWWTLTEQSPTQLKFERTDTHYNWYAAFNFIPDDEGKDLPKLLEEKLDLEKIEFDPDVTFETDSRVLFRNSGVQEQFQEVIRVEGKATQNATERIYYDIYLMRRLDAKNYFMLESRSSVLNGSLEGPYFEESLSELSFIRES